jgi:uncharacterized iron-regulated membrane protein
VTIDAEESDRTAAAVPDSAWARLRPLLVRLHFYAGVFVGPFILVAAITGLLYALVPQIDQALTRDHRLVEQVGDAPLPLLEQVQAARRAHPEGTIISIRPPATPEETTWVNLDVDDVPADYARTVFVDPYTGEVRGALTTYAEWMPVRAWFDEFHRNLHLGALGRNYSELAASWLWVVALAGLVLWIAHRAGTGRLRRILLPDRDTTGRRRLLSWHGALGVWVILGLLALSVTGMTWSKYAGQSVDRLQAALNGHAPAVDRSLTAEPTPMHSGHHHGAAPATQAAAELSEADALHCIDLAYETALNAGLQTPLYLFPPATAEEAWKVNERKRDWPARQDAIAVAPHTGEITDRVDFADWPLLAKLTRWAIDAHMGLLFGLANQVVLALVAVALIVMIVLGYRMWWRRRPTRGGLPKGPRRGALAALKPHEAVLVVVVLAAVGWFAPLFGLSLAAFVAVDVVLGWWRGRRADRLSR